LKTVYVRTKTKDEARKRAEWLYMILRDCTPVIADLHTFKRKIETMQQEHEEAIAEIEQDAAVYVEENKKIANMTSSEDTIRLQTERDTYKTMYEQLLNRLVNGGAA
jgi:hypothetical protein